MKLRLTGIVTVVLVLNASAQGRTTRVGSSSDLQRAIDRAADGDTLALESGTFAANPTHFTDSLCGNCLDPKTPVSASYGFTISAKSLTLIGAGQEKTTLVTRAGYGVWIHDAGIIEIRALAITDGVRDLDGNATDAGIVVRRSRVTLEQVTVRDNTHRDSSVVVGIGGVFGREGADLSIRDCRIRNNGWDGIALYRGATAVVTDCLIEKGRGAGIGVTWDATCGALRNTVTGYWKGIGSFGISSVIARNNLVHDNLGWGMIATGESTMEMTNNVIAHNGNCGVAAWGTESRGRMINNIIVDNGWRDQWVCPCVGVWNYGDWSRWVFRNNLVWNNAKGQYEGIWDQTELNGNLSIDPKFDSAAAYRLAHDSPTRHAGDSTMTNPDGTRSHIGIEGGPAAR